MKVSAEKMFEMAKQAVRSEGRATLTATGTSMLPFIRPGDLVTIEARERYERGDIVLARATGPHPVVLHAVVCPSAIGYTLMGTANLQLTESCTPADIAGAVVTVGREGRVVSMASRRRRAAMSAWLRLRPVRRYLMFIYRRTRRL